MRRLRTKALKGSSGVEGGAAAAVAAVVPAEEVENGSSTTKKKQQQQSPPPPLPQHNMDALNADVFKNFDKGKSEFLKFLKHQLKDNDSPVLGKNDEFKQSISSAIYDLLWHGLRCTVKKDTVLNTLGEVVALHNDFPSLILDIINILDAETSLMTDGIQEERMMLCQLVKDLDKVVSDKLIKERLEIDTLQDVGIVKNKVFYTKFIKIKTKLYYKQRRFNLFREESEGYAKLITELNQEFEEDVTPNSIMDMIKSLIGCFNLDPNRVLDIILESFETRPERWQLFIPLLRSYMHTGSIICEVLGYKFRYFADTKTPKSLFHLCALLLKNGVIQLNDIYPWLTPTDKEISADWERELADARAYVRKLNIVVTNKERDPTETEDETVYSEDKYYANQKFGLCEGLLKVGDWANAQRIIKKLPEQCVMVHEPIARALCELIHLSIDHLYTKKCYSPHKPRTYKLSEDTELCKLLEAREFVDLRAYAIPMAIALGPSLHYDTALMYRILRLLRMIVGEMGVDSLNAPVQNTESEKLYYDVLTLMDTSILPSLSYLDCNCPMAEEIWTVLRYFPYHFRYSLYARWKNDTYQLHPALIRRRGKAEQDIKAQMKRVSKETVKLVGRLIGKLTHCAPGFLFDYILLQIKIYDNLIGPVVDSLKFLTTLSFDCLGYCLIETLAMADRDRFQHDGTSISQWLQSLASFCGAIFKKYNIELSGLLQYVANQLKSQKSLDLLILKEIVQKMAGVESAEEMTNEQLNAMCGGELLRGEAGYFSQVRNTKKSSQRLKDALAYNDLAVTICLLMAQQKHCVIYQETTKSHLKLVGKLYDQCQDTLVQFGTFLGSTYSVDEYVERLPSIIAMLQEYHINADVAFFLARPMFTHQINQKYDQLRKADPNAKKLTTNQKLQKYLEATNLIMNPIVESVRPLHGTKVWEDISPQFLVTFWSLSMYDLQVPADSYQKEISKLKQLSLQAADSKDSNASKNKKEQERYIALMDKLQDERKKQQEHVDKVLQRLQQQKDNWFLSRSAKSAKNETITQFLQLCLFPRCTFTALDALYCAKFVHTIHNLKAANFSTLLCYDRIFCDITYSVTSCTENEATRYGRFLCAMLETVMRWHADQATFNRECANFPGFVTKFRVSNQFSDANDHVGYENYRHVCHKWHYKITKAIVFCLDSKDYVQIRNAVIILKGILPHYPVLSKLSQIIERKVEKVREEEKNQRRDLFAIASSYIGQLKTRAKQMIKESDFHQVAERPVVKTENNGAANVSAQAATQPAGTATNAATTAASTAANNSTAERTQTQSGNAASNAATLTSSPSSGKTISNGDVKSEKRDKERSAERPKIIKLNSSSRGDSNNIYPEGLSMYCDIPPVEIKDDVYVSAAHGNSGNVNSSVSAASSYVGNNSSNNNANNSSSNNNNNSSSSNNNERDHDRHAGSSGGGGGSSSSRQLKEQRKEERTREKERERERERDRDHRSVNNLDEYDASGSLPSSRSKREKRRDERYRTEGLTSPIYWDAVGVDNNNAENNNTSSSSNRHDYHHHDGERDYERERVRDRDLSSVSNESATSQQQPHRRNADMSEYEKESKRRKMDSSAASSSNSKKQQQMQQQQQQQQQQHQQMFSEHNEPSGSSSSTKKERSLRSKERKEKLTDEEKDARKERKLERKRGRLEESNNSSTSNAEHKRRRDAQNGDDDVRETRDKYHTREKSPHIRDARERSHEKFERDRSARDERSQYSTLKSTRSSRINY